MAKSSHEFKLKVVHAYIEDKGGTSYLSMNKMKNRKCVP